MTKGVIINRAFNRLLWSIQKPESSKEQRLAHREGAEVFYRALAARGVSRCVSVWKPADMRAGSNDY